ncbi:MAG: RNA-binding protein [Puia sp.]|nr:RNA-binding protein [Puia sp.]
MKLFIAGLPYDFDDVDLKEMFELYGEVNSAKVALDKETRKSRGFGFLDMPNDNEALEAIQALNGANLKGGKQLSVKKSEEQPRPGFGNRGPDRGPDRRPGGGPGGRRY